MDGPVKIGERVSWPTASGDCFGTVQGVADRGNRQLLVVLADNGCSHSLIVAPAARGGTELLTILPNHAEAVALARTILAGGEPRMPPTRQVLTLAAALAAPECLPKPKEQETDERTG